MNHGRLAFRHKGSRVRWTQATRRLYPRIIQVPGKTEIGHGRTARRRKRGVNRHPIRVGLHRSSRMTRNPDPRTVQSRKRMRFLKMILPNYPSPGGCLPSGAMGSRGSAWSRRRSTCSPPTGKAPFSPGVSKNGPGLAAPATMNSNGSPPGNMKSAPNRPHGSPARERGFELVRNQPISCFGKSERCAYSERFEIPWAIL